MITHPRNLEESIDVLFFSSVSQRPPKPLLKNTHLFFKD
jgi:hypothetical protein